MKQSTDETQGIIGCFAIVALLCLAMAAGAFWGWGAFFLTCAVVLLICIVLIMIGARK